MVYKNLHKVLWRKFKRQVQRIANSEADADSSSDESIESSAKQRKMVSARTHFLDNFDTCDWKQKRSHSTHAIRPSGFAKNKCKYYFVANENVTISSSEDFEVKIKSIERVTFSKISQSSQVLILPQTMSVYAHSLIPAVESQVISPSQNMDIKEKEDTLGHEMKIVEEYEEVTDNFQENGENLVTTPKLYMFATRNQMQDEIGNVLSEVYTDNNTAGQSKEQMLLMGKNQAERQKAEIKLDQKISKYKTNRKANYAKEFQDRMMKQYKELEFSIETRKTKEFIVQNVHAISGRMEEQFATIVNSKYTLKDKHAISGRMEEKFATIVNSKYTLKDKESSCLDSLRLATSEELKKNVWTQPDVFIILKYKNIKGNSQTLDIRPALVSVVRLIIIGLSLLIKMHTDAEFEERYQYKLRKIKVYRNVISNETYRMMKSVDMIVPVAKHLFGLERTKIFFDLAAKFLNFGSAGAISEFVPNMAESEVRQNVISVFEQSCDTLNLLMTLLLSCPDGKTLQQMPQQHFISLIQSVIESLLKTKNKRRKRLSSKGNTFIMVDREEFERVLGEEMPEDVLDRLRRGDELVVHRFVDARLERTEVSEKRDKRAIHSIYFPSDCRLFIYIPTESGSYWHHLDMQRANRMSAS